MWLDKKGFTLVEVMIALVVLLLVFLALMQTALVSIDANMRNLLRDEAVGIADMRMLALRPRVMTLGLGGPNPDPDLVATGDPVIHRTIRNAPVDFTPTVTVAGDSNTRQITVRVTWEWRENTIANGNAYFHEIASIVRR